MLQRTLSFCRKLIGNPETSSGGGTAVAQDDRRLWVRYHADIEAQVQVDQVDAAERVSVRIQNISIGGASLISDRPLAVGKIVSLELPAGDDLQIVLACVVRVTPLGDGEWSLGCAFSREVSSADLARIGAGSAPASDQRAWIRHECDLQASYQSVGESEGGPLVAKVLNVSASGIGLVLDQPVEAGSLLNVDLHDKQGKPVRTILACVVHSTQRANGEVVVGCNFIRELGEDELQAFL
jgi:hypothetical protein